MTRLLRLRRPEASAIDPHWDFERAEDASYDRSARRFKRVRVLVPGPEPAAVRLLLSRIESDKSIELPAAEHVWRFTGGAEISADSYAPVSGPAIVVPPPLLVLAVDLTGLMPGEHVLSTSIPPAGPGEVRFEIVRRPFHAFPPLPSGAPRQGKLEVRSATGLGRVEIDGGSRPATAHVWRVVRKAWAARGSLTGEYREEAAIDVVAITLFDDALAPERTRWTALPAGEGARPLEVLDAAAFTSLRVPAEHEHDGDGFGLPFPILIGLPSQPRADGSHPRRG